MKSSEAQPLNAQELETLRSLMERWVLRSNPYYDGSSEQSDAIQTYYSIQRDAEKGEMYKWDAEELNDNIKRHGETSL